MTDFIINKNSTEFNKIMLYFNLIISARTLGYGQENELNYILRHGLRKNIYRNDVDKTFFRRHEKVRTD